MHDNGYTTNLQPAGLAQVTNRKYQPIYIIQLGEHHYVRPLKVIEKHLLILMRQMLPSSRSSMMLKRLNG
jgi:hypothetical protein